MISFPILSLLIFLPIAGVLFLLFIRGDAETVARNSRNTALLTSVFTFALSLYMYMGFDGTSAEMQFVEKMPWLPGLNINYKVGIDGISVFFILLSTFLTPICILASWESVTHRVKEYMISFLLLETMMLGMFCALDLMLFYVFFEGVLIPMFIIIGVWGGKRRVYSAFKFFLYTLLGSVLLLLAALYLYNTYGTTDIVELQNLSIPMGVQKWLWLAFLASFAVKVPMWPVHTWLPDAHVEAPTAGSVILAGVLLKMGGYGFLRLSLPVFPDASVHYAPWIFGFSVVAVIYTSLVALAQEDMKKLIAYSSVAHMGFVTIGIFAMNQNGLDGAMFQMLSHGIVSAALFLCVGVVYDRLHTREITRYGGLVKNMPKYATIFMVFMLASVGLPGTSGFVGEFLVLNGTYQVNTTVTALAATGVILGAAYMLFLYKRVVFGELSKPDVKAMKDVVGREVLIFLPMIGLVFWMGIYPSSFTAPMAPALKKVIDRVAPARQAALEAAAPKEAEEKANEAAVAAEKTSEAVAETPANPAPETVEPVAPEEPVESEQAAPPEKPKKGKKKK
ncbi:MAG TPA: NADH-quinone oxidoreductase subunit M [Patescibacteria group bacterium]|nr:NADH-quinone oxidoreductase subunit M [Patescibacteria group bacterium]